MKSRGKISARPLQGTSGRKCRRLGRRARASTIPVLAALVFSMLVPRVGEAAFTKDRMSKTPITAGLRTSFSLHDGQVLGWGLDLVGSMGTGLPPQSNRPLPTPVAGLDSVVAISTTYLHTLALKDDGTVWAWGFNQTGQLGTGDTSSSDVPIQVLGLPPIKAVAAGKAHSLAVDEAGAVWAWGCNAFGELGLGTSGGGFVTFTTTPAKIPTLSNITEVAAGWFHSLAVDDSGQVWAWGRNGFGQIGIGTFSFDEPVPKLATGLSGIVQVRAGKSHSLALDDSWQVWAFGRDILGQLGEGSTWIDRNTPTLLPTLPPIVSIAAGEDHNLAADVDGRVWAWGDDSSGQLGDGGGPNRFTPIEVTGLRDVIVDVAAGSDHSHAVSIHGVDYGWGDNFHGQVGNGTASLNHIPFFPTKAVFHFPYQVLVVMLTAAPVTDISGIEGDMSRLAEDIGRLSFGKVLMEFDYAGPFVADPIADIGCNRDSGDSALTKQYTVERAFVEGFEVEKYAHIYIRWHQNLSPPCRAGQNGSIPSIDYSGGTLIGTGISVASGIDFRSTKNRHVLAHEFLHGYGSGPPGAVVPEVAGLSCFPGPAFEFSSSTAGSSGHPCTGLRFLAPMDVLTDGATQASNTDAAPNLNGVLKNWFRWVSPADTAFVETGGIFDLYPLDDDALQEETYVIRMPVTGTVPAGRIQEYVLEYRKQARVGLPPDNAIRAGVYLFLSQSFPDRVPKSLVLRTQDDLTTVDSITPLSTIVPTIVDPSGLLVEVVEINPDFARVCIGFSSFCDSDNDGIASVIDTEPNVFSDDFDDGTTTGTITSRGDQVLSLTDSTEPSPDDGVRVAADPSGGSTAAMISASGEPLSTP